MLVNIFSQRAAPEEKMHLLGLTSHNGLKLEWIKSQNEEEIIDLMKLKEDFKAKLTILSMCKPKTREAVIHKLQQNDDEGQFNEIKLSAMTYFGMYALKKDSLNM